MRRRPEKLACLPPAAFVVLVALVVAFVALVVFAVFAAFVVFAVFAMNRPRQSRPDGCPESRTQRCVHRGSRLPGAGTCPAPGVDACYFSSTFAPASSSFALIDSASALATPSFTVLGAPSTRSLA